MIFIDPTDRSHPIAFFLSSSRHTLQYTATPRHTLQHTATHLLQATSWQQMQHKSLATPRNTLQHPATPRHTHSAQVFPRRVRKQSRNHDLDQYSAHEQDLLPRIK